jgi:GTP-binding protein Era
MNKVAGTVALVGRPNAGKSTLLNHLLDEKVAIVSNKPQTTRHRLVGILSDEQHGQIVFYDTPGVHKPQHRMNKRMIKAAQDALADADLVCLLVDASEAPGNGDAFMRGWVAQVETPKLVLLNKVDRLRNKDKLLPRIATYAEAGFNEIIPISARTGEGVAAVLDLMWKRLPHGEARYDPELLTVHPERFQVAERIREKVLFVTRDELPFATAVELEAWVEREDGLLEIYASVLVERESQKKIVIGRGGAMVKSIGTAARLDLEVYLGQRIFLDLQVRVARDWRQDERVLERLDRAPYDVDLVTRESE